MSQGDLSTPISARNTGGDPTVRFLVGGGACGEILRSIDWASHPLGPLIGWPIALRVTVRLILNSKHPMFIFWGRDLFCFYNDAYSRVVGSDRHPAMMGQPGRAAWAEIWDIISPQIDLVMRGDGATWHENQLIPITRDGARADVWWTYGYSPIDDETAAQGVGGVLVVCNDVTSERKARVEMAEIEARASAQAKELGDIYAASPVGLAVFDRDLRFLRVNERLAEINGFSVEEHLGRTIHELLAPDVLAPIEAIRDRVLLGEWVEGVELEAPYPEGDRIGNWLVSYRPMFDGAGNVEQMLCTVVDVTASKEIERSLAASEERYRLACGAFDGYVFDWDLDSGRVDRSEGITRLLSFDEQECEPAVQWWRDRLHPEDAPRSTQDVVRVMGNQEDRFETEVRLRRKDDTWIWVVDSGNVLRDEEGRPRRVVGTTIDITERKRAEEDMQKSEARLKLGVEVADLGLGAMDYHAGTITMDRRAAQLFDLPADTPIPREAVHSRFHPEDRLNLLPQIARLVGPEGEDFMAVEHRILRPDNTVVWVSARKSIVHALDDKGERRAVSGMLALIDITALKEAENKLQDLIFNLEHRVIEAIAGRRLWADLVEANDAFILALDCDYQVIAINGANVREFERIYGQVIKTGDNLIDKFGNYPDQQARARQVWGRALSGDSFIVTDQFGDEAMGKRWYELKLSPLRNSEGRIIGASQICYEVTERVRQQEALDRSQAQLFEAQKMETIGQLTGGVAHDFNNLLSAILSNLDLLKKRANDPRSEKLIDGALKGAERGAALTRRLLAFARRQELKTESVSLSLLIAEMEDLLDRSLGLGMRIATDLPRDLPNVSVDPNQLELAILNLAVNARDAMPFGGTLTIDAAAVIVNAGDGDALSPGAYVRLRVADTGKGMDEATLKRAIEPFFTTKGIGKGTGLGLSMVHGLVTQSGGTMTIESQSGRGTIISLMLPQAHESQVEERQPHIEPRYETSNNRPLMVLVVDDDMLVSMGTVAMLEDLGHHVLEANSGRAALELLTAYPAIDLVITDHAMPGMTGVELAKAIESMRPGLAVVLATGYAELPNGEDPGLPRLPKPFRQDDLSALIDAFGVEDRNGNVLAFRRT
jgi:PAS domain S-box-containing protein